MKDLTRHRHKVLVTDDEEYVRNTIKRALRAIEDCVIVTASNSTEARRILETQDDVEVLISDQKMPGDSGVDLLSWVKLNRPDVVTIMLTGYADLETAMKAINEGQVFKFLTKPWEKDNLVDVVSQAIDVYHKMKEAKRLLKERNEEARRIIEELEATYPGITKVERDEAGRIILDGVE